MCQNCSIHVYECVLFFVSFECLLVCLDIHVFLYFQKTRHRLLDSLVVSCWLRVQEVPGLIPSQDRLIDSLVVEC